MKTVNIQVAKAQLSQLVDEAAAGEEIVLAKAGHPLVRLVPFGGKKQRRRLGQFEGIVEERPGCWEIDSAVEAQFSGRPALPFEKS